MRREPTWRIPVGLLALLVILGIYGLLVARYIHPPIADWPIVGKTLVYLVLGLVWLLPLRRFLIWMETGRWSPPPSDTDNI